jgi:hypothetical protein
MVWVGCEGIPALQVMFLGIDNIHVMRSSLNDLRDVISHASKARGGGWGWAWVTGRLGEGSIGP